MKIFLNDFNFFELDDLGLAYLALICAFGKFTLYDFVEPKDWYLLNKYLKGKE